MADPRLWRDAPNGRLVCAICIEWVDFADLAVDADGHPWDMCKPCAEREAVASVLLFMSGGRR